MLVSSKRGLEGKILTEFIALIIISYLDQKMKTSKLYGTYTMNQLLDKHDVIECFEYPKHVNTIGEILSEQQKHMQS